jgi:hypothetical protein
VLKTFIRAALVLRLVSRDLYLDPGLILLAWLRRPVIEMPLEAMTWVRRGAARRQEAARRRLDEVYPF